MVRLHPKLTVLQKRAVERPFASLFLRGRKVSAGKPGGNRGYPGGNRAQEFLTTSFLAFSGLKMPKTTSLEIPGLDSPLRF